MARWLIAHGADVNAARPDGQTVLMEQAAAGNADIVRVLVNAGAKLDTVSSKWHTTALQRALDAEKLDVVRILRDAGAKDETVTETKGQALRDDDPPVRACLAYLDAIQHEDLNAMLKVSTFKSFDDVDFKVWKAIAPGASEAGQRPCHRGCRDGRAPRRDSQRRVRDLDVSARPPRHRMASQQRTVGDAPHQQRAVGPPTTKKNVGRTL